MDKIRDLGSDRMEYGRASANEASNESNKNSSAQLSPPIFQLRAVSPEIQTSEAEETSVELPSLQMAAEGIDPPDDLPPSDVDDKNGQSLQMKENNTGLPDQLKSGIENLSGFSLDDVKVHYNSSEPAQLNAHAFAKGSDIHLASGQERHLPHEAWHVVQQKQGRVKATTQLKGIGINDDKELEKEADVMGARAMQNQNSSTNTQLSNNQSSNSILQGKFVNAQTGKSRTTLRQYVAGENEAYEVGNNLQGNSIKRWTKLLVDDDGNGRRIPNDPDNVRYRQAINVNIKTDDLSNIPDNKIGWVNAEKVTLGKEPTLESVISNKISDILTSVPDYGHLLNNPDTVNKILNGAVRYKSEGNGWKNFASKAFARALQLTFSSVIPKIQAGAVFTGQMLAHWQSELGNDVEISSCVFTESDLHEHGLGVVFTTFKKTGNDVSPMWTKFAGASNEVELVLKPENKALEEALIGSQAGSAANQINNLLGLAPDRSLGTLKMETTTTKGSMIEKVDGYNMKSFAKQTASAKGADPNQGDNTLKTYLEGIDFAIAPAFHETMVFAFIAGIGDLHWENVMYRDDKKPILIDADNVIEHDQMEKQNYGGAVQSGFGTYNNTAATENHEAMETMDTSYDKSTLFTQMINNYVVRDQIKAILKGALANKSARVVPVGTGKWANFVNNYKGMDNAGRTALINRCGSEDFIVNGNYGNESVGAGLKGNCHVAAGGGDFKTDIEKQQLKIDFDGGIIPFYNYDFNTGHVSHNGKDNVIYKGQTADEAIENMIDKFIDAELNDFFTNLLV